MPEPDAPNASEARSRARPDGIALLHDLTRWREQLARSIARNNLELRSDQITAAVNRILFPLLLLRIAEDRHLLPEGSLAGLRNHQTATASHPCSCPVRGCTVCLTTPSDSCLPPSDAGRSCCRRPGYQFVFLRRILSRRRRYDFADDADRGNCAGPDAVSHPDRSAVQPRTRQWSWTPTKRSYPAGPELHRSP